jgi:hypothetical protein
MTRWAVLILVGACGASAKPPVMFAHASVILPGARTLLFARDASHVATQAADGSLHVVGVRDQSEVTLESTGIATSLAWRADSSEWLVGVVVREPLTGAERHRLQQEGEFVPLDGKVDRARVLRFDRSGTLVGTNDVATDAGPLALLAVDPLGALVRVRSDAPSCGSAPAHDEVRFAGGAPQLVPGCRLGTPQHGALAVMPDAIVAAVTACSNFDRVDSVQLLAFDRSGTPASAPAVGLPSSRNAFDLRAHRGKVWLLRAFAGDVIVQSVASDAAVVEPAILIDSGSDPVTTVAFVGDGDELSAIVQRGTSSHRIELSALGSGRALPRAKPLPAVRIPRCPAH